MGCAVVGRETVVVANHTRVAAVADRTAYRQLAGIQMVGEQAGHGSSGSVEERRCSRCDRSDRLLGREHGTCPYQP